MSVAKVGSLVELQDGTTALAGEVMSNFDALRDAFNALVAGADEINVDIISEVTLGNGVVVDGVELKDGGITASGDVDVGGTLTFGVLDLAGGVTVNDPGWADAGGYLPDSSGGYKLDARHENSGSGLSRPSYLFYATSASGGDVKGVEISAHSGINVASDTVHGLELNAYTGGDAIGMVLNARAGGSGTGMDLNMRASTDSVGIDMDFVVNGVTTCYGMDVLFQSTGVDEGAGLRIRGGPVKSVGAASGAVANVILEDADEFYIYTDVGANLTAAGVWADASSRTIKRNIQPVRAGAQDPKTTEARQALMDLQPVVFDRRLSAKPDAGGRPSERWHVGDIGFVAEDVPDLVAQGNRKGVAPGRIAALAVLGVQELLERMDEAETRIAALETPTP